MKMYGKHLFNALLIPSIMWASHDVQSIGKTNFY